MTIKDYDNHFIEYVMKNMGEAFCFAELYGHLDLDTFMTLFIRSGVANEIETGNPAYTFGISGTELVYKIYERSGIKFKKRTPFYESERLDTYWAGYILAYYQYKTGLTYKYIHEQISIHRIRELYYPLHEASEEKAINVISKLIKKKYVTRLQQRRKLLNISQRKLAIKARVNIRTLQEYEVGTKSINKASALTVYNLSKVLNCNVKDLLELI